MTKTAIKSLEDTLRQPFFKGDAEKRDCLQILIEGIKAASPERFLPEFVKYNKIIHKGRTIKDLSSYDNLYIVAVGKAADSMATVMDSILKISAGIVIIPQYSDTIVKKSDKFEVVKAGHPFPNRNSLKAAKKTIQFLNSTKKDKDFVLFLISGGGSSLLSYPFGTTMKEKVRLTSALMKAGATISELNCVRKHLSKVKGGRLVEGLSCDALSLVMSDVIGDNFSTISSGITYYDNSTYDDAVDVVYKYGLESEISKKTLNHLLLGRQGKVQETPKKNTIDHVLVANNITCLNAMKTKAKKLGYSTYVKYPARGSAGTLVSRMLPHLPKAKKSCLIFGGETTVVVRGKGLGGRNQELVLRSIDTILKKRERTLVASIGTDGRDGNSVGAGAMITNYETNYDCWERFLANNDSFSFFKKYGGLIVTGPTHTNLMDIGMILKRK